MSQSRTLSVSIDTVRRIKTDGTEHTGSGKSKHYYVGRNGSYDYSSFIKFALDWTNVGSIVSATLNLYTDEYDTFGSAGEPGIMAAPKTTDIPTIATIRRLTAAFTEGSTADGQFASADYVAPTYTSTGAVSGALMAKGADLLKSIDITAIVRAWAPSTVAGGGLATNHGIGLYGSTDATKNWSGWAREHAGGGGAAERATITLVYEFGPTVPNTPTNLTPAGNVSTLTSFQGDFSDVRTTDKLQSVSIEIYDAGHSATATASTDKITQSAAHGLVVGNSVYFTAVGTSGLLAMQRYYVQAVVNSTTFAVSATSGGAAVDITADSAVTWSLLVGSLAHTASQTEQSGAHFIVPKPLTLAIFATRTYRWRARYTDNEGQTSAWTSLTSFVLTDTAPNDPVLSPVNASSYASLNLVKFTGGTFSDADSGDVLGSHQVQLSPYPSGDARWTEADGILWDTGQVYEAVGATSWVEYYGGRALTAGTYYWRARQWDQKGGVSNWVYAQIILTADFSPDPANYSNVQVNTHAPWRIIIRDLFQSNGTTPTVGRAPGNIVAVMEEAKNVGASVVYNSPGELHFTLLKDDPQIAVIEPKQVHYALEFYSGDGWQEKYAGVIWDIDATEVDVVFKGLDYLALYDTNVDERYDPLNPDKSYASGGSKYSNVTIRNVVLDQLNYAKGRTDSWVGHISIGTVDAMDELVTVYSTMAPTLQFVSGLLDSHRQGTGKRTRMKVSKTTGGTYQLTITDNPGTLRSDLAMYYGELVQGYRIIAFGDGWGNVQHVIGRNRDGLKVVYNTISGQAFQPSTSTYGRIANVVVFDGVNDQNDLNRRGLQAAIQSAKLGKNIAIGIRTEFLKPLQGWDITDTFPLTIKDGAIDTTQFGSGIWAAYAAAWEATDIGEQSLVITFLPREDSSAPNANLLQSSPISPQAEWQLGWVPPDPLVTSSKYYLDQSSGIVYARQSDGTYVRTDGDPRNNNGLVNSGFEMNPIATVLTKVWTAAADWATATSTVNLATGGTELTMTTSTY